jgi:hypothetical protein
MPNPFMRLGSPNRAQGSPVDRERPTGAQEPVPEHVHGTVFPYRGMDPHGVDPNNDGWRNTEEYEGKYTRGLPIEYEALESGPEAIPVYIVDTNEKGREYHTGNVFRTYAPGTTGGNSATRIVSSDVASRRRTKARVKNLDTATVYIGLGSEQATLAQGWPLAQNETFEHAGESEIWAVSSGANDAAMAVYIEYTTVYSND